MPGTVTQNIPAWVLPAIQGCAFSSEMTNAAFREFVRHQFIGSQAGTETSGALNTDATKETGAQPRARRQNSNAGTGAGTGTRTRRGSRREELLNLINEGNGISRGEILERMGLKGNKAGEMSVSNALTALTKRNHAKREDGKYYIDQWTPPTGDVVTLPGSAQQEGQREIA